LDQNSMKANALDVLAGQELNAVVFIKDYVQLQFDDSGLTAVTNPAVTTGVNVYGFGSSGYRDALCERIGRTVTKAHLAEEEEIRIDFDDGTAICISLKPEHYIGPEAAIFHHGEDTWVW
jgi:hypothetical protein